MLAKNKLALKIQICYNNIKMLGDRQEAYAEFNHKNKFIIRCSIILKGSKMKIRNILLNILLIFSIISTINVTARATQVEKIRVAYILDHGFYTNEENGGLSGYNYDFLMLVAQHTGWDYDFIEVNEGSYDKSMEFAQQLLEQGEIDLLGTIYKTEETLEKFEFPLNHTGVCRYNLVSLVNNYKITKDNYFLQDVISIVLVEDEDINKTYAKLVELRELNYEITYVKTREEALSLLVEEKVDTMIEKDVSQQSWMLNDLITVDRIPFYFVAKKGDFALINELDRAVDKITVEEPNVHQRLLNEYFAIMHQGNIILTTEEQEALKDYDHLTIGLLKGREPYQFFDGDDDDIPKGISVEILEQISDIIGMKFEYVWLESREEMKDKIASKEIDLCSTVPYDSDFELTYFFDVVITQPYLTNAVVWLHQNEEDRGTNPHFYYLADNIPFFPDSELVEVFDFKEKLLDLSQNGGFTMFADPYMAQYYIQKLGISNIEMQSVSSLQSKICFGVGKHLDSAVVGLLNHALLHLDSYAVDEIIYENVTVQGGVTLEAFFREHMIGILVCVTLGLFLIILFLYINGKKLKLITQQDSLTKLYNAGFFHQYTADKMNKLKSGCLILIDIDYFKQVNDTYGHQEGDTIIIKVANSLKSHFGSDAIVARLGGDEFIILLEYEPEVDQLELRCSEILRELALEDESVAVTLSIGGFIFKETMVYKDLYQSADKILYKVKEKGRNGFLFS